MTWPANATRAEVIRILEINRNNFHHWVISREETDVVLAFLGAGPQVPIGPDEEALERLDSDVDRPS